MGGEPFLEKARRVKVPQTLMLVGEESSGRGVLAKFLLALELCCHQGHGCGDCEGCRLALSEENPDVWESSSLKVENLRAMHAHLALHPRGIGKVKGSKMAILRGVHTLTPGAAGMLLKILEEPPPLAKIILITSSPGQVLPTLRSRVAIWNLPKLSLEQKIQLIQNKSQSHGLSLSSSEALGVLNHYQGLHGKALGDFDAWKQQKGWGKTQEDLHILFTSTNPREILEAAERLKDCVQDMNDLRREVEIFWRQSETSSVGSDRLWARRKKLQEVLRKSSWGRIKFHVQMAWEAMGLAGL